MKNLCAITLAREIFASVLNEYDLGPLGYKMEKKDLITILIQVKLLEI